MILTCPNCSTRYNVDAETLGPQGRKVRCVKCGHSWVHEPAPVAIVPPPEPEPEPIPQQLGPEPQPYPEVPHEPSPRTRDLRAHLGQDLSARPRRSVWPGILVWLIFLVIVAAIVGGTYRYRQQFVELWPPVAKLYEAIGIDVTMPPGYGLVLTIEHTRRETVLGDPVLVLEGSIANDTGRPRAVPNVRVILRDGEKQPVQDWIFAPDAQDLPAGSSIKFRTSVRKPDPAATDVTFEFLARE